MFKQACPTKEAIHQFPHPYFTIEVHCLDPNKWNPFAIEGYVVTREKADVLFPSGRTPKPYTTIAGVRLAAETCNMYARLIASWQDMAHCSWGQAMIKGFQRSIDAICYLPASEN